MAAKVIVARHGLRLDAAQRDWHLSTPVPYDPPLTYSGWSQSRALGERIADLLPDSDAEHPYQILIHSSPYTRCIETSVGIASGLISSRRHPHSKKATLRVDEFLGEWLNPVYYEHITPPPPSHMMLAAAKATLLRNETIDEYIPSVTAARSSSSRLWTRSASTSTTTGSGTIAPLVRSRSITATADLPPSTESILRPDGDHYIAPVPQYAISVTGPIPKGYFTHARERCVDVDMAWNSSREPLDWGDGGQYGESWASMQRRFRRGLAKLVQYYSEEAIQPTVVILVTHGAGCNALIGALTGQPVLVDVGMGSLTLAERKTTPPTQTSSTQKPSTQSSSDDPSNCLSKEYTVSVLASTEHLRAVHSRSASHAKAQSGCDALVFETAAPASVKKRLPSPLKLPAWSMDGEEAPADTSPSTKDASPGLWTPPSPTVVKTAGEAKDWKPGRVDGIRKGVGGIVLNDETAERCHKRRWTANHL